MQDSKSVYMTTVEVQVWLNCFKIITSKLVTHALRQTLSAAQTMNVYNYYAWSDYYNECSSWRCANVSRQVSRVL